MYTALLNSLTLNQKSSSLKKEGVSLFERHPPHFSTAVYTSVDADKRQLQAQDVFGQMNRLLRELRVSETKGARLS